MLAPNTRRVEGKDGWEIRDCTTGERLNRYIVVTRDDEREEVYAKDEWEAGNLMHEWRSKIARFVVKCACGEETWCGYNCPHEQTRYGKYPYYGEITTECDYSCIRK